MLQKDELLKFSKKLSVFILLLITLDFTIGKTLEFFFFRMKGGEAARATYAMQNVNDDVVVFGSSRANHHYVPQVFEESLKQSFYNVGREGQGILYGYAVLQTILKRAQPKIVIVDIKLDEFDMQSDSYDRLSFLLPYYNKNPELKDIIYLRSPYEKFKTFSQLYLYNSSILQIAANNIIKRGKDHYKGYISISNVWNKPLVEAPKAYSKIDPIKVNIMEKFIRDSKRAGSKVFVFVSPTYSKFSEEPVSIKVAREVCERNGIYFNSHNQNELFLNNSNLFKDIGHLNNKGAQVYSEIVSNEIRANLKEMPQLSFQKQ